MTLETINFEDTGFFTDLICDYLAEHPSLHAFYNRYPSLESFESQIQEKADFDPDRRQTLVTALQKQYAATDTSELTQENIGLLANAKTFTITTGHQLNLFTGPLYFLYKIISVIRLAETLKEKYPGYHFVPVYWMATEDHDFDEINFFNFNGKKFQWQGPKNEDEGGAVGRMPPLHMEELEALFRAELGPGKYALYLAELFKKAYLGHEDLTSATRFLANELFAKKGLVIIDGDDAKLKRIFLPHMKTDLLENRAFHEVTKTIGKLEGLSKNYKVQVNPRAINLFFLDRGVRDRVIFDGTSFGLADGARKWTPEALMSMLEEHPEKFSPNVMLRPLYQEAILPNLCYIGGGGELAYWLELKSFFEASEVVFPMLLLRDSVLLMTEKQRKKLEKLHISPAQLFLDEHSFINRKVREISDIEIDLSKQREHLVAQFSHMYEIAEKTDKSFLGAVKAQEVKQLKGLDHLEKRLLKAQKRKLSDQVARMTAIRSELFPNGSLQERTVNFAHFYKDHGDDLITILMENLDPLDERFKVVTL